jgi:hypothetical protein
MNTRTQRYTMGVVVALGLLGCATPGKPPPGGERVFRCEQQAFTGPVTPTPPGSWDPPSTQPRGYVHIQFFVHEGRVYAFGVPVNEVRAGQAFFVGPMQDLQAAFPPGEAAKELQRYPDWHAFYRALFRAFGNSRPLALVCPGPDCPTTPEHPPPGVLGMTATYSTQITGSLDTSSDLPRLAALDDQGAGTTATDAAPAPGTAAPAPFQSSDQQRELRAFFSDTVTRAVCAARILVGDAK